MRTRKPDKWDKMAENMWPTIKANFNLEPGHVNSLTLIAKSLRRIDRAAESRGMRKGIRAGGAVALRAVLKAEADGRVRPTKLEKR
jgi:hypothetical protein